MLTQEQDQAVTLATEGRLLKIEAGAGTGKTSTLAAIANALFPNHGLYLAFDRAMRESAEQRMPANVICKTFHALAYAALGRHYQERLKRRLTVSLVRDVLSIEPVTVANRILTPDLIASTVLTTVQRFCHTVDSEIGPQHIPPAALSEILPVSQRDRLQDPRFSEQLAQRFFPIIAPHAVALWQQLTDASSDLPIFHDVYLKLWAMSRPLLPYAFILVDEAQDANPLMLHILEIQSAQLIYVGDRYQQIYAWRGAENAMVLAQADRVTRLTQSFRFGEAIADHANAVLRHFLDVDFGLRGNPQHASQLAPVDAPDWILCRSNATAIAEIVGQMLTSRKTALLGNRRQLLYLLQGAQELAAGLPTRIPEFLGFLSWDEVRAFAETVSGSHLRSLVRLVDQYGADYLLGVIDRLETNPAQAEVWVSTLHQAKGKEAARVRLADDFVAREDPRCTDEEAHIAYVAVTRARDLLDVSGCRALAPLLPAGSLAHDVPSSPDKAPFAASPDRSLTITVPGTVWDVLVDRFGSETQIAQRITREIQSWSQSLAAAPQNRDSEKPVL
jgi:superfamily I DNA/RNA helicase